MFSGPEHSVFALDAAASAPVGEICRPEHAPEASSRQFSSAVGERLAALGRTCNSITGLVGAYALIGLIHGVAWLDDRYSSAFPARRLDSPPPAQATPVARRFTAGALASPLSPTAAAASDELPAWLFNFLAQPSSEATGHPIQDRSSPGFPAVPAWTLSEGGTPLPVARRIADHAATDQTIYRTVRLRAGTTTIARYVPMGEYAGFVADWLNRNPDGKVI